jgi:hypothetical protein
VITIIYSNNNIFYFLIIFSDIHENNVLLGHKMMCSFYCYSNKILHFGVKDVYCLNLEYLGGPPQDILGILGGVRSQS